MPYAKYDGPFCNYANEMPSEPVDHDKFIPAQFNVVGKRGLRRIDGRCKADGSAVFTTDVELPGMLYARHYLSPLPSANIKSLDTSAAEALPGVVKVIRYDDPEIKEKVYVAGAYMIGGPILLGACTWQNEPMGAFVVAESLDIADKAIGLLKFEWEELPLKTDLDLANVTGDPTIEDVGDVDTAFAHSDKIIEWDGERKYNGMGSAEPNAAVAKWEGDWLELWLHHQHPYAFKYQISSAWGIPMSKITIHAPYNGAQNGGVCWLWQSTTSIHLTAYASMKVKRPVKYIGTRAEDFSFGECDWDKWHAKVGANNDGTINAVSVRYVGAEGSGGLLNHFHENTKVKNMHREWYNQLPSINRGNLTPGLRCEQNAASMFFQDVCNHVAGELGLDTIQVALKNDGCEGQSIPEMSQYKTEHGFPDRDSLAEVIEAGKKLIDWENKWHLPGTKQLPNGNYHGIGFAWDHEWSDCRGAGECAMRMNPDGTVNILGTRADIGTNSETAYCMIAAEELGVPYETVSLKQQNDYSMEMCTPDGSMNTVSNGYLVVKAARRLKRKLLELAVQAIPSQTAPREALFPGLQPEDLDVKDGFVFEKTNPDNKKDVRTVCFQREGMWIPYPGAQMQCWDPVYSYAFHRQGVFNIREGMYRIQRQADFIEVEVNPDTGLVEVKNAIAVNDVGKVICPESCEGQCYGGLTFGVSRSRAEEYVVDPATGVLLTPNLYEYKLATIKDIENTGYQLLETSMGLGPYGLNGIGENQATMATYCLEYAVYNAIGKWVDVRPMTPDNVLKALGKG